MLVDPAGWVEGIKCTGRGIPSRIDVISEARDEPAPVIVLKRRDSRMLDVPPDPRLISSAPVSVRRPGSSPALGGYPDPEPLRCDVSQRSLLLARRTGMYCLEKHRVGNVEWWKGAYKSSPKPYLQDGLDPRSMTVKTQGTSAPDVNRVLPTSHRTAAEWDMVSHKASLARKENLP
jgi:hypothetical protein